MSKGPTKGPWTVADGTTSGKVVLALDEPKVRRNVAACGGPNRSGNAALIAAAPELLAVAQYAEVILVDVFEGKTDPVTALDAISDLAKPAIAKATGAGA